MSDSFAFGDILVFAVIAAFIILRYRSMLGEKTGRDAKDIEREKEERRARAMQQMQRVVQLPQKVSDATVILDTMGGKDVHSAYGGELKETLDKAQKIDADFNAEDFLEGAKSAFEMVIDAYSKRDDDTLKMLLAKPVYAQFSDAIKASEQEGKITHNTLVAINKAQITEAKLVGTQATISVEFLSDQIQLLRSPAGEILEGNASEEIEVEDRWVFARDLRSASPNWSIIET